MSVLHEYFRAPDRDAARARPLSVLHGTPELAVDVIDAKDHDPVVVMGRLMALVLNRSWSVDLVGCEVVWPEGDPPADSREEADLPADSPWNFGLVLTELDVSFRDAFADVDDCSLPWIADQWYRIEELDGRGDARSALDFIEEFVALARRAGQAGELIYCMTCV